jgi:hypothetical protein
MPDREAKHTFRTRRAGENGRLEKTLEVDGGVISPRAQHRRRIHPCLHGSRLEDDARVDDRNQSDDFLMRRVDKPVNPCLGQRAAERSDGGQGVDDVAKRSKPHDQNAHYAVSLIRASRSRVE